MEKTILKELAQQQADKECSEIRFLNINSLESNVENRLLWFDHWATN